MHVLTGTETYPQKYGGKANVYRGYMGGGNLTDDTLCGY